MGTQGDYVSGASTFHVNTVGYGTVNISKIHLVHNKVLFVLSGLPDHQADHTIKLHVLWHPVERGVDVDSRGSLSHTITYMATMLNNISLNMITN